MARVFPGCRHSVMARGTGSRRNIDMVEHRRGPGIGGVAIIAGVAAGNVVGRLAGGDRAVVTAEAAAQHVGMVDPQHR